MYTLWKLQMPITQKKQNRVHFSVFLVIYSNRMAYENAIGVLNGNHMPVFS